MHMKTLHKVTIATIATLTMASAAYAASITIGVGSGVTVVGNTASGGTGVTVSATVNPVLYMTLSGTAINFWALTPGTPSTITDGTDVSVTSNTSNFNVQATYGDLMHTDGTTHLPFAIADRSGSVVTGGNVINQPTYSATPVVSSINYTATPDANQKAGNYSTAVTYTVTGNF